MRLRDFCIILATTAAYILLSIGALMCVQRATASEKQVEGLEYVGRFGDARVYHAPLGHVLSGCVILEWHLNYAGNTYAVGCR